jgi:hypothetical protein
MTHSECNNVNHALAATPLFSGSNAVGCPPRLHSITVSPGGQLAEFCCKTLAEVTVQRLKDLNCTL